MFKCLLCFLFIAISKNVYSLECYVSELSGFKDCGKYFTDLGLAVSPGTEFVCKTIRLNYRVLYVSIQGCMKATDSCDKLENNVEAASGGVASFSPDSISCDRCNTDYCNSDVGRTIDLNPSDGSQSASVETSTSSTTIVTEPVEILANDFGSTTTELNTVVENSRKFSKISKPCIFMIGVLGVTVVVLICAVVFHIVKKKKNRGVYKV